MAGQIQFLPPEESWNSAEEFRSNLPSEYREIPVPIFDIIEFVLNINIVPAEGIQSKFDAGGTLSVDCSEIVIDKVQYESSGAGYRRSRMSAAIEVGHFVLHRDMINELVNDMMSMGERSWREFAMRNMTPSNYGRLNIQALEFAGRLLVPRDELIIAIQSNASEQLAHPQFNDLQEEQKAKGLATTICDHFDLTIEVLQARIQQEGILTELD